MKSRYSDYYFHSITDEQYDILEKIAYAFDKKAFSKINPNSDICTPSFCLDFENRLKIYHALHENVLNKKSFEYAFCKASQASKLESHVEINPVQAGADVIVGNIAYSLKTESSASIKPNKIHISKFSEAAWIRNCKTIQDFIYNINEKLILHTQNYGRILVLRAFKIKEDTFRYFLIEIPKQLLLQMENASEKDFSKITSRNSTAANIYGNSSTPLYKLRFDGSVEKVTLANIDTQNCIWHAEWDIPIISKIT